ncbi:hypothetical protein TNCV_4622531 [Trichonephila clavipes]|nr:hypothetical protein TNCV_4622531 [Trichonephila clavipes]
MSTFSPNVASQHRSYTGGKGSSRIFERFLAKYESYAFRRDSSSKPETDEIHLVRDQDCMADGLGVLDQEFHHGFVLLLPSVLWNCHPTTEHHIREAQAPFSESISLIKVDLHPIVYRCPARSPAVSSFTLSR